MSGLMEWLAAVILALVLGLGVQTYRIGRLKHDVDVVRTERDTARAEAKSCADNREREAQTAIHSFDGLTSACSAERTIAVNAGRTLERIVHEPAPAPGAARRIIGAGELSALTGDPAKP